MASSRIATLRHQIFSYIPGKAVPCDDERVVFPDRLVIGIFDMSWYTDYQNDLRRAVHRDVKASKLDDKLQQSPKEQEEYITDYISVIERHDGLGFNVRDLARKVGCMVLLIEPRCIQNYHRDPFGYIKEVITLIKEVTGRPPLCALLPDGDIPKARNELTELGITDIYKVNELPHSYSGEDQLQWLNFLHGCLQEGDRAFATNNLNKICKSLNEKTEEARRQVEQLQTENGDEKARAEKEKRSLAAEMTKKLDSKQQRVDTLMKTVKEKERNETILRQQVEELKQAREGDRARGEKEKQSIELSWKKECDYKEELLEQLKRETWKLRTKIQLESEMRSAEQKKRAETHQWSFISWVTSGKQTQGGTSSFDEISTGGLGKNDTLQAGEEPPDDEFAGILQQIADDLYDEAKIDSLAGQLGILHGDIQRALMTNVKFNRDRIRHMLKQWRRGVSREDERIELRNALQAAKLVNLADLYLSEGVAEEHIGAECVNKEVDDEQLSTREEASLEEDQTIGHTDTQVLQEATASNDHTPRDGHTGNMASKTQEDFTDGSRIQHPDKSPVHRTENLDVSEVTSEEMSYEKVSSSEKPNEESTTLDTSHVVGIISNEDLISQLVLIDTSPEKILLLFLVKIIMDVSHRPTEHL